MCVHVFLCSAVLCKAVALRPADPQSQGVLQYVQKQIHKFQKSNSESEQARGPNRNLPVLIQTSGTVNN
jgi:hypothetical protein